MKTAFQRVLVTTAATAMVTVAGGQGTASAGTQWVNDDFNVCVDQACTMSVGGTITWLNRSAQVDGAVLNNVADSTATAYFDAFAGSTKVDGMRVPAVREPGSKYPLMVEFDVPIGDPAVVGGIDRIRIQICSSVKRCSVQWNEIRD